MSKQHNPGFLKVAEAARTRIKELSIDDLQTRLTRGERLNLIDVREDHEWNAGHLPTARHLGRGILERDIESHIKDPQTEIILYCGGGYRSALAADSLRQMGYANVYSLAGGFRGWTDKGYKIEGHHER